MMRDLIMLIGLPGCGKSTYRKPYPNVLSTDDYIEHVAKLHGKTYNESFEKAAKVAEYQMYAIMQHYIDMDKETIVWDQTNLTPKTRMAKLKRFNEAGGSHYRKIALFFEPDLSLSIIRQKERQEIGRAIPLHVLENMNSQITMPTKAEGFDYVFVAPTSS